MKKKPIFGIDYPQISKPLWILLSSGWKAAFIQKFYGELTPEEIAAAVHAYMPKDFILMAQENPCFIVEEDGNPIGFFNLKRKDNATAEIPLIYLDLDRPGGGFGTACIEYMEKWLEVNNLVVDTVIPKYNSGF